MMGFVQFVVLLINVSFVVHTHFLVFLVLLAVVPYVAAFRGVFASVFAAADKFIRRFKKLSSNGFPGIAEMYFGLFSTEAGLHTTFFSLLFLYFSKDSLSNNGYFTLLLYVYYMCCLIFTAVYIYTSFESFFLVKKILKPFEREENILKNYPRFKIYFVEAIGLILSLFFMVRFFLSKKYEKSLENEER